MIIIICTTVRIDTEHSTGGHVIVIVAPVLIFISYLIANRDGLVYVHIIAAEI